MKLQFTPLALVAALLVAPQASGLTLTEVARLDVFFAFQSALGDPPVEDTNVKFIGTNPLGIAWNGDQLYLAGYDNNGPSILDIGIIEVLNAGSLVGEVFVNDAGFSDAFGQITQPIGRGYTGLDLQGNRLAASYDNGNATANGIQVFDTTTNSLLWDLSASSATGRGGSGVAFDPGFPGGNPAQGAGVAWTTFGSGRRALNDTETGATIWQLDDTMPTTLGMQWLTDTPGVGNFARDMTFDPDTGDVYTRRSNDVDAADRTGDNATDNRRTIVDNGSNANFVIGHKIEFLSDTEDGDLLIYNDRAAQSTGQLFTDIVKVVDTDGVAQSTTFNLLNGDDVNALEGNGIYDFSYDAGTDTLAVMDFTNRIVHIFSLSAVTGGLTGDYNGDGTVDAADYTVWRDTLGESVSPAGSGADGNNNGFIDTDDYTQWVNNYGATAPPAVAVPEPAAVLLVAVGLLAGLSRRV